jgi:hypothetical protein
MAVVVVASTVEMVAVALGLMVLPPQVARSYQAVAKIRPTVSPLTTFRLLGLSGQDTETPLNGGSKCIVITSRLNSIRVLCITTMACIIYLPPRKACDLQVLFVYYHDVVSEYM